MLLNFDHFQKILKSCIVQNAGLAQEHGILSARVLVSQETAFTHQNKYLNEKVHELTHNESP